MTTLPRKQVRYARPGHYAFLQNQPPAFDRLRIFLLEKKVGPARFVYSRTNGEPNDLNTLVSNDTLHIS